MVDSIIWYLLLRLENPCKDVIQNDSTLVQDSAKAVSTKARFPGVALIITSSPFSSGLSFPDTSTFHACPPNN
jgi:hypothetical protein